MALANASSPPHPHHPHSHSSQFYYYYQGRDDQDEDDEEEEEGYFADFSSEQDDDDDSDNSAAVTTTTPFIIISSPASSSVLLPNSSSIISKKTTTTTNNNNNSQHHHQFSVVAFVAAALRRSLVTCSVVDDDNDDDDVDISWPTDVRHVSHVTFDRFNGFLGLPLDLQPHLPPKPPSASARVFGVSAQSMQCSYDHRGNSVPTILLTMQNRLYSQGGLQAEGIFRINPENTQEENVRNQLNTGVVPHGIDVHCLSGLIKAWFRELPTGVLDSLTPEQVMHCNTEQDCTHLVNLLPPTESALLDWAINLMTDVAQHENHNKMNARNIAMVFAPNMTQMADPLTALIHAVQVMNLLKTLIIKNLREREEEEEESVNHANKLFTECTDHHESLQNIHDSTGMIVHAEQAFEDCSCKEEVVAANAEMVHCDDNKDSLNYVRSENDVGDQKYDECSSSSLDKNSPTMRKRRTLGHSLKEEYDNMEAEGILNRLSLRKGIQRLCQHPVFQLTKVVKRSGGMEL